MTTPTGDGRSVAVFDLDGTLARSHSVPRFAATVAGPAGFAVAAARSLPRLLTPPRRPEYKRRLFRLIMEGRSADEIRALGEQSAADIVDHRLDRRCVSVLERHRSHHHQLVLLTAALDVYAWPVARRLGFDACLSARVEIVHGRCTGRIHDADLHGQRKLRRLQGWLGERADSATVYAYGNSRDDDHVSDWARRSQTRGSGADRPRPAGSDRVTG